MTSEDDDLPSPSDLDFRDAIHSAASFFKAVASRMESASESELKPLLNYLRSDREFGRGEREDLAWLLSGGYRFKKGPPSLSAKELSRRADMKKRYVTLRDHGLTQSEAVQKVADDLGEKFDPVDEIRKRGWK